MTCKVSFFNSIRETLKHHIASTFVSVLVFFSQFLVFLLQIQNIANDYSFSNYINDEYLREDLLDLTRPSFLYWAPVAFVAVVLAYDYFRYLHSKKQMDFFECLPVKRSTWFFDKIITTILVFLVPYLTCTVLEGTLLLAYKFTEPVFFTNLLSNVFCMILLFAVTWITAVLAMVMTGHPVVAALGFGVFCGYAPVLLRYIFPAYADEFFETYVSGVTYASIGRYVFSNDTLLYFSPIGLASKLLGDYYNGWTFSEHVTDILVLLVILFVTFSLTYKLYLKRPSEAAGRAMSFEKFNPVIRILLVIPLSLYLGLYLSLVTDVGQKVWMVTGFILGVVLLHGIIESIFQFDIRGLWSHKIQMVLCFLATFGIAFTFWIDLFGYDSYLPKYENVDSIVINSYDTYFYNYSESDGLHGEAKDIAYELVSQVVKDPYNSEWKTSLRVTHILKNGKKVTRRYRIDSTEYLDLLNKLYVTEDYKNDICALYTLDRDTITSIKWNDNVEYYPLNLSKEQQDMLFDLYLSELTPLTYSDIVEAHSIGSIEIRCQKELFEEYSSLYVFPTMKETISYLEELFVSNEFTNSYGSIDSTPFDRYDIRALDLYSEDGPFYTKDSAVIEALKEFLIYEDEFYKAGNKFDDTLYYSGSAEVYTYNGTTYISILVEKEILAPYMN